MLAISRINMIFASKRWQRLLRRLSFDYTAPLSTPRVEIFFHIFKKTFHEDITIVSKTSARPARRTDEASATCARDVGQAAGAPYRADICPHIELTIEEAFY